MTNFFNKVLKKLPKENEKVYNEIIKKIDEIDDLNDSSEKDLQILINKFKEKGREDNISNLSNLSDISQISDMTPLSQIEDWSQIPNIPVKIETSQPTNPNPNENSQPLNLSQVIDLSTQSTIQSMIQSQPFSQSQNFMSQDPSNPFSQADPNTPMTTNLNTNIPSGPYSPKSDSSPPTPRFPRGSPGNSPNEEMCSQRSWVREDEKVKEEFMKGLSEGVKKWFGLKRNKHFLKDEKKDEDESGQDAGDKNERGIDYSNVVKQEDGSTLIEIHKTKYA